MNGTKDLIRALRDAAYFDGTREEHSTSKRCDAAEAAILAHVEGMKSQSDRVRELEIQLGEVNEFNASKAAELVDRIWKLEAELADTKDLARGFRAALAETAREKKKEGERG